MNLPIPQLFTSLESNVTQASIKKYCSIASNVAKLIELHPHPMTSSLKNFRVFEISNLLNTAFYTVSICEITNKLFKSAHKIVKLNTPKKQKIRFRRRVGKSVNVKKLCVDNKNNKKQQKTSRRRTFKSAEVKKHCVDNKNNKKWMKTAAIVINIAHDSLELIVWFSRHPSTNLFVMGNVAQLTISITVCSIKITKDLLDAHRKGKLDTTKCVNIISKAIVVTIASHGVLGLITSKTGFKLSCCTKKSIQCVCNIAIQILYTDQASGCTGGCCS
jgi:hypothetical protein